jgi:hypothetical protein
MRIYYRGPDCLVTSKFFVWRTAPARFAIRDLSLDPPTQSVSIAVDHFCMG